MLSIAPRISSGVKAMCASRMAFGRRGRSVAAAQVPYSLPGVGEIVHVQVASNTFNSIKPGGSSDAGWSHVNLEVWGGGVFVPWYGTLGAYVIGGANGGHGNGCNYYASVWPVATGEWALLAPTNTGISPLFGYGSGQNHAEAATNGASYFEITAASGEVPAAAHPYRNQVPWQLGSNGSLLWIGFGARCAESRHDRSVHRVALGASDITYSRHSSNVGVSARATADDAVAVVGEYCYVIDQSNNSRRSIERYRPSTGAWDLFPGTDFDFPPSNCTGNGFVFAHLDRYLLKRGNASDLFIFDTQTPANGWVAVTTSGTMPASVVDVPARISANYYWVPIGGGAGLTKLVPPGNPVSGTWAFSTATMSSGSFPAHPAVGQANAMYTATFTVPINSVEYLGHCVGGAYGMHLCRPE